MPLPKLFPEPTLEPVTHGTISPEQLRASSNPVFARLAQAVEERNASGGEAVNYSRMHHRHNRSQRG